MAEVDHWLSVVIHSFSYAMQTLFHMHCAAKVCHLDLSPDNVMLLLDKSNPWNTLKLIDFGLACMFNPGKVSIASTACGVMHSSLRIMF